LVNLDVVGHVLLTFGIRRVFKKRKKIHTHISDHPVCAYEDRYEEQTVVYVGVVFRCQRCLCLWGGGWGRMEWEEERLTSNL